MSPTSFPSDHNSWAKTISKEDKTSKSLSQQQQKESQNKKPKR
jgi:hypothetical protein